MDYIKVYREYYQKLINDEISLPEIYRESFKDLAHKAYAIVLANKDWKTYVEAQNREHDEMVKKTLREAKERSALRQ
jgi:hypothetical protein